MGKVIQLPIALQLDSLYSVARMGVGVGLPICVCMSVCFPNFRTRCDLARAKGDVSRTVAAVIIRGSGWW